MAITKIHAIKATVDKAVNYICNPAKTDESILISSFGCSPETAAFDFKFALSKTSQADTNKAFHLIQAFLPGEVSYKEAHQIGTELADKLLEGKFSYVVATHIDKGHVHNHIIFCAADNINHEKYYDCKKTYYNIRRLNDRLCTEHQLSVIEPRNQRERGKKYKEWLSDKNDTSYKTKLRTDIDETIQTANIYEDFLALIRAKGYEVKGETFGENSQKYISFRPLEGKHFIRGRAGSLGANYTKERIKERIEEKSLVKTKRKSIIKDYSSRKLIDTSEEKFEQSPGLKAWADIQNLKIAASTYSQAGSIAELEKQIAAKTNLSKTARNSLIETERQLKDLGQILKYAEQYKENHIYQVRYKKSKNPDAYLRQHETQLLLHDGAKTMLKRFGIEPKSVDVEKLRRQYNALYAKRESLQKTYKSTEKEVNALTRKLDNLNHYLDRTEGEKASPEKKATRTHPSL
jgi:hypothetical protein